MRLRHITAAVTAAAMLCGMHAAAEDTMIFRLDSSVHYLNAADLAEEDAVFSGTFSILNYTDLTSLRTVLTADAPLVIENGHFTEPYYFESASYRSYTQKSVTNDDTNIVSWTGPDDLETGTAVCVVENPDSSFAEFEIRVPQGTAPGVYQLGFRQGSTQTSVGKEIPDTYIYNGMAEVPVNFETCSIIIEPEAMRGDVNCDGVINTRDAKAALDYYTLTELTLMEPDDAALTQLFGTPYIHTALSAADAKQDDKITREDAYGILCYYTIGLTEMTPEWEQIFGEVD